MQSIATSASVATPRSQFRVLRRASCALDVAVVDAVVAAGIRAVVFDFDLCVLSIHSYGERLEPHHVLARAPLADDFVDLDFFRALVTALAARGVRVAIASFGRYDVIQTYLDRVFVRACESGSESAPGSSSNFFTRDTISTPTCVGGKDGAEVDGGKNPQLQKLAEFFKVLPSEMLFFDGTYLGPLTFQTSAALRVWSLTCHPHQPLHRQIRSQIFTGLQRGHSKMQCIALLVSTATRGLEQLRSWYGAQCLVTSLRLRPRHYLSSSSLLKLMLRFLAARCAPPARLPHDTLLRRSHRVTSTISRGLGTARFQNRVPSARLHLGRRSQQLTSRTLNARL